jgi:hypothetical protein
MSYTKERNARWLGMSHAQLVMECQDLCQQRDELLAALETLARSLPQIACERAQMMDYANRVISSVKGAA